MAYKYNPTTRDELLNAINKEVEAQGYDADLNCIDTSSVTDMSYVFSNWDFNGDISEWDTSSVEDMSCMFFNSKFNGDISKWDVSGVYNMYCMFFRSKFNQDISNWDVRDDCYTEGMYDNCEINPRFKHDYLDLSKDINVEDLY